MPPPLRSSVWGSAAAGQALFQCHPPCRLEASFAEEGIEGIARLDEALDGGELELVEVRQQGREELATDAPASVLGVNADRDDAPAPRDAELPRLDVSDDEADRASVGDGDLAEVRREL